MSDRSSIGKLRHRLVIQSLTNATDSQGGQATTWSDLATVWGNLQPKSAGEAYFAQQIQYRRTHVAWIRHRDDVTASMRISFDSRLFQIKGIRKPDERKFFMILDLEENVAT